LEAEDRVTRPPAITQQQRDELDQRHTVGAGLTLLRKIDDAGRAVAVVAKMLLAGSVDGKQIIVLAGPGNNGAGGLAAARYLHDESARVHVVLAVKPGALHEMASHQYSLLQGLGLEAWGLSLSQEEMAGQEPIPWTAVDLIIDALLGPGIESEPHGDAAELIRLINAARRPILSYDVPSGLRGDEGAILSPCVDATATVTLGLPLQSHLEGWPVVGELWLADAGIPHDLYAQMGIDADQVFAGRAALSLGPARKLKQ
jgi:NAD(P)H-hydrate epimerase